MAWPLAIDSKGEIGVPPGVPSAEDNILGYAFVLISADNNDAPGALALTQDHPIACGQVNFKPGWFDEQGNHRSDSCSNGALSRFQILAQVFNLVTNS